MKCSGNAVETCSSGGTWSAAVACPGSSTCANGLCIAPGCLVSGPGLSNCGVRDDAGSAESCCTSIEVPGGAYYRTYNTGDSTSGPPDGGWTDLADPATVSAFRLDKYLVTVGRFRQFVNAVYPNGPDGGTGWLPTPGSGKHTHLNGGQGLVNSGADAGVVYETGWATSDNDNIAPTNTNLSSGPWSTWTDSPAGQENLPINCVNWWEAYAFCIWDGGFLPSEAEWEYAAAGGSEQRWYPWGSTPPGTMSQYAIYGDSSGCYYPGETACTGAANIAPVGTAVSGAGLWGQLDLAGDVSEWNLDWEATYVDPCNDCVYLTPTSAGRVMRGGRFDAPASYLVAASRSSGGNVTIPYRFSGLGFRCARSP